MHTKVTNLGDKRDKFIEFCNGYLKDTNKIKLIRDSGNGVLECGRKDKTKIKGTPFIVFSSKKHNQDNNVVNFISKKKRYDDIKEKNIVVLNNTFPLNLLKNLEDLFMMTVIVNIMLEEFKEVNEFIACDQVNKDAISMLLALYLHSAFYMHYKGENYKSKISYSEKELREFEGYLSTISICISADVNIRDYTDNEEICNYIETTVNLAKPIVNGVIHYEKVDKSMVEKFMDNIESMRKQLKW